MKRCIKWFINWFVRVGRKMTWEEKVGFALGGVLGIAIGIPVFVYTDKVPATKLDYDPLKDQVQVHMIANQENPGRNANKEDMTITFENEECKIIARYDQNFNVLSTLEVDKATFWLWTLGSAIIIGVVVNAVGAMLITCVIQFLLVSKANKSKFKRQ